MLTTISGDVSGDEARAIRRGMGLTARQVAEELGLTESTVFRFEWRKEREVPRVYARALRDLLRERTRNGAAGDPKNLQQT